MNYFRGIEKYFENNGLPKPKGCSDSEITEIEQSIDASLPESYKQYLRWMGKDYEGVLSGTDCFIDSISDNTKYLPDLLRENLIIYELSIKYLAFFCHQDYAIAWFNLPKVSENPPCYYFSEGGKKEVTQYPNFIEFISSEILDMAKCRLELIRARKSSTRTLKNADP